MKKILFTLIALLSFSRAFSQAIPPPVNPQDVLTMKWYYEPSTKKMFAWRGSTLVYWQPTDSLQVARMIAAAFTSGYVTAAGNNNFTGTNQFQNTVSFNGTVNLGSNVSITPTFVSGTSTPFLFVNGDGKISASNGLGFYNGSGITWNMRNTYNAGAIFNSTPPDFYNSFNFHNGNNFTSQTDNRLLVYSPSNDDRVGYVPTTGYFAKIDGGNSFTGIQTFNGNINRVSIDSTGLSIQKNNNNENYISLHNNLTDEYSLLTPNSYYATVGSNAHRMSTSGLQFTDLTSPFTKRTSVVYTPPTQSNIITLPNASGTVILNADTLANPASINSGSFSVLATDSATNKYTKISINNAAKFRQKINSGALVTINYFGNSLFYGQMANGGVNTQINGATQTRTRYPIPETADTILTRYGMPHVVNNYGYPGDRAIDGLTRWNSILGGDIAFVEYGINEALNFGGLGVQNVTLAKYNLTRFYEALLSKGTYVVFVRSHHIATTGGSANEDKLKLYRESETQICQQLNIPILDMAESIHGIFQPYDINGGSKSVHLTDVAYSEIGASTAAFVMRAGILSQPVGVGDRFHDADNLIFGSNNAITALTPSTTGLTIRQNSGTTTVFSMYVKQRTLMYVKQLSSSGSAQTLTWQYGNGIPKASITSSATSATTLTRTNLFILEPGYRTLSVTAPSGNAFIDEIGFDDPNGNLSRDGKFTNRVVNTTQTDTLTQTFSQVSINSSNDLNLFAGGVQQVKVNPSGGISFQNGGVFTDPGVGVYAFNGVTSTKGVTFQADNSYTVGTAASGASVVFSRVFRSGASTITLNAGGTNVFSSTNAGIFTFPGYTTAGILHNAVTTGLISSSLVQSADLASSLALPGTPTVATPAFSTTATAIVNQAYLPTAAPVILATVTGINAKTTGTTAVYTVPTGKTAVVTGFIVRCTAATAITIGPSVSVTSTTGTVYANTALTGLTTANTTFSFGNGISVSPVAADVINFVIGTAATGTSQTVEITLIGYLR